MLRTLLLSLVSLWLIGGCAWPQDPVIPPVWQARNAGLLPHVPVTAFAFERSSEMVAGVYSHQGIYASQDGKTWQRIGGLDQPVHDLLIDDRGIGHAATADGLYLRVADEWQRMPEWPLARAAFSLAQGSAGILYAGGEPALDRAPQLWQSTDGLTWQLTRPLPTPADSAILAVEATRDLLLAGTDGHGLFTSRDGGDTWAMAASIGETFVAALWVAPEDSNLILARTRRGLFRSLDGAATWQPVGQDLEGRPDAIGAESAAEIFLGMSTGQVLRSMDLGNTWQPWSRLDRDGLFYTLRVDPDNAEQLFAGTHWGLYRSTDRGRSWEFLPHLGRPRGTALVQSEDGALYLGNDDGVYIWDGDRWQPRADGLPRRTVNGLALVSGSPRVLFAGTDAGVYRSLDGGESWHALGWTDRAISGLALDPDDGNRLYVNLAFERIYSTDLALEVDLVARSAVEPEDWNARWEGMPVTTEILSLAVDPRDPSRLYAGGATDLFASQDRANTWSPIGAELAGQSVFALIVDLEAPQRLYAGATNGLYRSNDGGQSWMRLGLDAITVTALALASDGSGTIYAGTLYNGIWASLDDGATWQSLGPADGTVHDLIVRADGTLVAATETGVLWKGLP